MIFCHGCKTVGRIRSGGTVVTGVADAGKPASLDTGESKQAVAIPANSPVSVTKTEAVPATATTPFRPAMEVFSFTPAKDTRYEAVSSTLRADTGTVDTSIAAKRIEAQEARILLYASIAALVGAGVFLWLKYPTPAMMCGAASVLFFVCWRLADLPPWLWAVGLVALAGAAFLWLGHEKGEKHAAANLPTP